MLSDKKCGYSLDDRLLKIRLTQKKRRRKFALRLERVCPCRHCGGKTLRINKDLRSSSAFSNKNAHKIDISITVPLFSCFRIRFVAEQNTFNSNLILII